MEPAGARLPLLRRSALSALAFALCAVPAPARAACPQPPSAACVEGEARAALAAGRPREAIDLLLAAAAAFPDARPPALLLAAAYLAEKNEFWALKALASVTAARPDDCEAGLWTAWVWLRMRSPDDARAALAAAACPADGPLRVRALLLEAAAHLASGAAQPARDALALAHAQPTAFPEDRALLGHLHALADPTHAPPVRLRAEADGGWTANALAGSPVDPASGADGTESALGKLRLAFDGLLPLRGRVRPVLEADLRAQGHAAAAARELSWLTFSGRPGVRAGPITLAYRGEALLLAGGDRYGAGPLWYSNGHRGEIDVAAGPVALFAGAGRRVFREAGRSRLEADAGLAVDGRPADFVALSGALSGRRHAADRAVWSQWGGSLLVSADWRLPRGLSLRTNLLFGADTYPESRGFFDPTQSRRELLVRGSATLWSPASWPLRPGLGWESAARRSTAASYDYTDHRILLKLAWTYSADPRPPRAQAREGHVPLEYGLAGERPTESARELLRQEDSAQRGSSCVER